MNLGEKFPLDDTPVTVSRDNPAQRGSGPRSVVSLSIQGSFSSLFFSLWIFRKALSCFSPGRSEIKGIFQSLVMNAYGWVLTIVNLLAVGAPPLTPSFSESWYREVFEGNVVLAATEYEILYLGQPSEDLPPRMRQRAAFRAGLCFQRLGLTQSAVPAFISASAMGHPLGDFQDPASALVAEANFRLRSLQGGMVSGAGADEARLEFAIQGMLEQLRATERSRFAAIASLEGSALSRRKVAQDCQELLARLRALGVDLMFPMPVGEAVGEAIQRGIREALGADVDYPRLLAALKGRCASEALSALLARDVERASRLLKSLAWLLSGGGGEGSDQPLRPLSEILRRIQTLPFSPGHISPGDVIVAERLLLDLELERKTTLCREIRARLDEAAAAEVRGRGDLALPALVRIRSALDWHLGSTREESEVRSLVATAGMRETSLVQSGKSAEAIQQMGRLLRGQSDRILQLCEAHRDEVGEELRLRGPASVGGVPDAINVVRAEVDRLLARARSGITPVGPDRATMEPPAEKALLELGQLLEWVPSAATAASRASLESLLASPTISSGANGVKTPETKANK